MLIKNNLEGKIIGNLSVDKMLEKAPCRERKYKCICSCGNECIVSHMKLIEESKKHKGLCCEECRNKRKQNNKTITNNLSGRKIGMLYVDNIVSGTKCRERKYNCICDCGRKKVRTHTYLISAIKHKRISSCGCYTKQFLKVGNSELCSKAGKHRKDSFVDGSNVQMTLREGTITTNTSGIQGVSWASNCNKWHVYVGYQNYRANLGYYEDKEDAIRIRRLAEDAIKDKTFEDFYFRIRGFHLGEKSQKYFKK